MKRKSILAALSLVFAGVVFGGVLVSGFGWVRPNFADVHIGSDNPPVSKVSPEAMAFNDAFINVADKVTPSIVQIEVISKVKNQYQDFFDQFPFFRNSPKGDDYNEMKGGGSGVIISEDGYILTNNHVVKDAKQVTVYMHNKKKYNATVIGTDPTTDLAVIKIEASGLPAAYLGDSDKIKVGQWVMAIGNPLSLSSTVTAGIISAVGRNLNMLNDGTNNRGIENYIQTDAAINPGNSGGALVDLNGAVVGINSAIATNGMTQSYIGYGFAIPVNLAKAVAKDLIAHGKITRGYIGVNITAVDQQTAKAIGLKEAKGVFVQSVVEGGGAEKAGLQEGDVIIKIDSKEVDEPNELQTYIATKRAGDQVKVILMRDRKEIEKYVTLKENASNGESLDNLIPKKSKELAGNDDSESAEFKNIGITVENLSNDELKSLNVKNGVIIKQVEKYSVAEDQLLSTGMVILQVDREKINSVSDLKKIFEKKKGDAVLIKVAYNKGNTRIIGLDIPNK
jgi:serine protease Do